MAQHGLPEHETRSSRGPNWEDDAGMTVIYYCQYGTSYSGETMFGERGKEGERHD